MNNAGKNILFIMRAAPHGNLRAQEALDVLLAASQFEHTISLLFAGDGVWQLLQRQDTTLLGIKNFTTAFKALPLYGIDNIYIAQHDLSLRGVTLEELLITAKALNDDAIKRLIAQQDIIFNF